MSQYFGYYGGSNGSSGGGGVSGSVTVTNFPAIQPVSGTVSVDNFPSTQTVNGTVNVGNFPTSQTINGSVSVSNFPSTQTVSGTVSVGNFPSTQTVSGSVSLVYLRSDFTTTLNNTTSTTPGTVSNPLTLNANRKKWFIQNLSSSANLDVILGVNTNPVFISLFPGQAYGESGVGGDVTTQGIFVKSTTASVPYTISEG